MGSRKNLQLQSLAPNNEQSDPSYVVAHEKD